VPRLVLARAEIVDAARRYVATTHALDGADPAGFQQAVIDQRDALHALIVAVDERCYWCDAGTCPLAPVVVDVIDPAGRV
jgi:hypothetical protein